MGWGRGFMPYPAQYGPMPSPTPEQEMEFLRSQSEYLEGELKAIQERLDQLQSDKKSE
jgi:hypothetical protein